MARPRYTGNGYTNPLNSLGFHAESRHRTSNPIGRQFMSNEVKVFEALSAAIIQTIQEIAEGAGKEAFQKALKEGLSETQAKAMQQGVEKAVRETAQEAAQKALKEGGEEAAQKIAKESAEAAATKSLKEAGEKTAKEVGEKTAKEVAEEGSEKLAKESSEGFLKKGAIYGFSSAIGVGVFALAGGLGWKAASDAMEDFAGLNCDEKALDAGLDEGTDEYTEYVEECQDKAATRMLILGVTGIVVIGGLIFLLLK